jgi:hypothetical protein
MSSNGEFITAEDVEEISDGLGDRTLLYGKTKAHFIWHVYFERSAIHKVVYAGGEFISHDLYQSVSPEKLIPNGRLYPEACDYLFCVLLSEMRINLPFAIYDRERTKKRFYGKTF